MTSIKLDAVIKSGESVVDMDDALDTLSGTASVSCLIADSILRGKVKERRTHADTVRASLKQSFKSSYGQRFDLIINDRKMSARLNKIGRATFTEVMNYYIATSLYLEINHLSTAAEEIIESLSDIEDELSDRLYNPLRKMHKITSSSGFNIELNYRARAEKYNIVTLDEVTAAIVNTQIQNDVVYNIEAAITRFNSMTGNGRLILRDDEIIRTIAFGFKDSLKYVTESRKKKISHNLHENNGKSKDERTYINLSVNDIKIANGNVVKFLITDIE